MQKSDEPVLWRLYPTTMRHVQQPPSSKVCGQACLAMILNITLDEAIKLVGVELENHGTQTKHLVAVLRKFGYNPPNRLLRWSKSVDVDTAILKINNRGRGHDWHWCAYHMGFYYDPAKPTPGSRSPGQVTSYLPIVI